MWTFNAVLDNKTNQLHTTIQGVKSVSAPDAEHVRPAPLDARLGVPREARDPDPAEARLVEVPDRQARQDQRPDPDRHDRRRTMLTQWHKNGTTIMTRNPKYDLFRNGGKVPAVKRILIHDVPEHRLGLPRRRPGEPRRRLRRARRLGRAREGQNPKLELMSAPRGGYWEIAFNSCPPTGSPICSGPAKGVKVDGRAGPRDPQGARLRHQPRVVHPRPSTDGQAATAYGLISPRFKLLLPGPVEGPEARLQLRPGEGQGRSSRTGGWNCSTTPCTKNGVKAEFELATLSDSDPDQQMAAARGGRRAQDRHRDRPVVPCRRTR